MSIYTKIASTLTLSLLCHLSVAGTAMPRGCEVSGFGFQSLYATFNDTGSQTFFLIQNRSNLNIELERIATKNSFMTPRLQTKINANQWAALASDVSNTHFKCFIRGNKDEITPLRCGEVLQICQYPRVRFALSNMGTFWVSTNKPQQQVIKDATTKGIYLKW
jgi:hypothetical protein